MPIKVICATQSPISHMGQVAGTCWGAPTGDPEKNFKRGMDCLESGHGRVAEYADVTLEISDYSARCIRELYTHIIGTTRLQESTRYIDCSKPDYFIPPSIENNKDAMTIYNSAMNVLYHAYGKLDELGIPREDIANLLPLGMKSKIILKINARALMHFAELRLCNRAYHEIIKLTLDIKKTLEEFDFEWGLFSNKFMNPKCANGGCKEKNSCGLR